MIELLEYARNLIDAVPVGLVTYDLFGQCVSANRAATRILGLNLEQLLSQNFRAIDSWASSGMLETAETTLSTGWGGQLSASLPTGYRSSARLDSRFETFVSGRLRYLLHVVIDAPVPGTRPLPEAGREND
ncbi:MAG TPA: PAS domain-containing protein [Rectinemataceae bacterium]|nr:PAS domain-containing protein [Rectinemataceae bacterium]